MLCSRRLRHTLSLMERKITNRYKKRILNKMSSRRVFRELECGRMAGWMGQVSEKSERKQTRTVEGEAKAEARRVRWKQKILLPTC